MDYNHQKQEEQYSKLREILKSMGATDIDVDGISIGFEYDNEHVFIISSAALEISIYNAI